MNFHQKFPIFQDLSENIVLLRVLRVTGFLYPLSMLFLVLQRLQWILSSVVPTGQGQGRTLQKSQLLCRLKVPLLGSDGGSGGWRSWSSDDGEWMVGWLGVKISIVFLCLFIHVFLCGNITKACGISTKQESFQETKKTPRKRSSKIKPDHKFPF